MAYCDPCSLSLPKLLSCSIYRPLELTIDCERTIKNVSTLEWDQFTASATSLLKRSYLEALERAQDDREHLYVLLRKNKVLVGVAHFHTSPFHGPSIAQIISKQAPVASKILDSMKMGVKPLKARVLVCGGGSATQGPALHMNPNIDHSHLLKTFADEAKKMMGASHASNPILAIIFQGYPQLASLSKNAFTRFESDPSMLLTLDPTWSFESYLQALTSKYRVKVKRADILSSQLSLITLDAQGARQWYQELQSTYQQVTQRAPFCIKAVEMDALPELLEDSRYSLVAYFLGERLIGFRLSMHEEGTLYAQLVGIDYRYNREYALYPRMLNDYVRDAIERHCHQLDFGRTAGEIKSTLGAEPLATDIYLAHANPFIHRCLPAISRRASIAEHKQHRPFRQIPISTND